MQKPHGFSLIELAVVMTVMAILTTAILPNFISSARGKYGERLAQDINELRQAAEAYYHQNGNQWPGQSEDGCQEVANVDGLDALAAEGFLGSKFHDPFSSEQYRFSYSLVGEKCHLQIHTPRNAKLSANLSHLRASNVLDLAGEPQCDQAQLTNQKEQSDEKQEYWACNFSFAEPELGVNFVHLVEGEVEEQVVPINDEVIRVDSKVDDVVENVGKEFDDVDDEIKDIWDRLNEATPSDEGGSNNDAPLNGLSQDEFRDFEGDVDDRFMDLNEQIDALETALNSSAAAPERYTTSFSNRYGYCLEGYTLEQCYPTAQAKYCTAMNNRASCEPRSSSVSGHQRCTMTCVR